jgi:predicted MPP superfamily phosphohydrolase
VHEQIGFRLLLNESVHIEKEGQKIALLGVENWGKRGFVKHGDLDKAIETIGDDEFKILLSHDPSHWEEKTVPHQKHIHLTMAGHTHGMQFGIEIPGIKWSPVKYIYKQWAGLYEKAGQHIYVNRGFGFIGFPGRVGILPEITVIELVKNNA